MEAAIDELKEDSWVHTHKYFTRVVPDRKFLPPGLVDDGGSSSSVHPGAGSPSLGPGLETETSIATIIKNTQKRPHEDDKAGSIIKQLKLESATQDNPAGLPSEEEITQVREPNMDLKIISGFRDAPRLHMRNISVAEDVNSFWRALAVGYCGNYSNNSRRWALMKEQTRLYFEFVYPRLGQAVVRELDPSWQLHPRYTIYNWLDDYAQKASEFTLRSQLKYGIKVSEGMYQVVADLFDIELLVFDSDTEYDERDISYQPTSKGGGGRYCDARDEAEGTATTIKCIPRGQHNRQQVLLYSYKNKEDSRCYAPLIPFDGLPSDWRFTAHMKTRKGNNPDKRRECAWTVHPENRRCPRAIRPRPVIPMVTAARVDEILSQARDIDATFDIHSD